MIARMWETAVRPGLLDEFCEWVKAAAWPQFVAAPGFAGGEVYRSDEHGRAVIVTRWSNADTLAAGNAWFDLGAERFTSREPSAWQFTPVDLD